MTSCHALLKMSQVQLKTNILNYFGEQPQQDTLLPFPSALIRTARSLENGPQAHNPCSLIGNIPEPRRGGGQVARNSPYRSLLLDCLWGEDRELWKPAVFYTRKLYGRFHSFVPVPFKDAWRESRSAQPPVCATRQKVGKAGEFSIADSHIILMA